MKIHKIAKLFPTLAGDDLRRLAEDIEANGQLVPCVKDGDVLLDGRNRIAACKLVNVEPQFEEFKGDSPVAFIIGANINRRHLTPSQKAALAVQIEPDFAKEAKKRQATSTGGRNPQLVATMRQAAGKSVDQAAEAVGASGRNVSHAKAVKEAAPELFDAIVTGDVTVAQAARAVKERGREAKRVANAVRVEQTSDIRTLEAVFSTLVVDPPWDWGDEGDVNQFGRAKPDYATTSLDELKAMPIEGLLDNNAHCYLWITNRSLPKGFELLSLWGFRYVTCLTWAKPSFGMGQYFRGQTEQILFGVRGSLALRRKNASTLFSAPRPQKKHSAKPPEFLEFVESCSPGPYLELFARSQRDGWTSWGADV